jgi:hypothetical protein
MHGLYRIQVTHSLLFVIRYFLLLGRGFHRPQWNWRNVHFWAQVCRRELSAEACWPILSLHGQCGPQHVSSTQINTGLLWSVSVFFCSFFETQCCCCSLPPLDTVEMGVSFSLRQNVHRILMGDTLSLGLSWKVRMWCV